MNEQQSAGGAVAPASENDKLMAGLGYWLSILTWCIGPLIIFLIKKDESAFVKKHTLQAVFLSIALFVVNIVVSFVTFGLGSLVISLVYLVYAAILGYQAYQGEDPNIPVITDMVAKV
ncbi:MAG: DUF4870 domain-containing protein [Cyanobacteria bacterium HKST-UBA06]|nr:DUF4870 domain-containing protein [Cyanobacteria bacterium HKST-UBA04]MCA9808010.1 DUF4870 domain-containing protein [Cyanobacteria bacterium HKST-UBA06]